MIGYIALFEAILWYHTMIWMLSPMNFIDFLDLHHFLRFTTTFGEFYSIRDYCLTLWVFNQILGYLFFTSMSLLMNLFLSFDLIFTLSDPFNSAKNRLKWYLTLSVILSLSVWAIQVYKSEQSCVSPRLADRTILQILSFLVFLIIYILVTLFALGFAIRRLYKPGISLELKQIFLKRHILYVWVFLFIWLLQLLTVYEEIFMIDDLDGKG